MLDGAGHGGCGSELGGGVEEPSCPLPVPVPVAVSVSVAAVSVSMSMSVSVSVTVAGSVGKRGSEHGEKLL